MKIHVLMENTASREGLSAEHGLSLYAETARHRILSDTGQSGRTWENAGKMGIDPKDVDIVVISHGHYDHAGGLLSFAAQNPHAKIYMQRSAAGEFYNKDHYIGIDREILKLPGLHLVDGDAVIDEELSLFSGITGRRLWPSGNRFLSEIVRGHQIQDSFGHEQCLVIMEADRQVLLSGCAHNGILNILDRYREKYGSLPDIVISGFHMMKKTPYTDHEVRVIEETARELSLLPIMFYTGHCTGQPAFEIMSRIMPDNLRPIHAGDVLDL